MLSYFYNLSKVKKIKLKKYRTDETYKLIFIIFILESSQFSFLQLSSFLQSIFLPCISERTSKSKINVEVISKIGSIFSTDKLENIIVGKPILAETESMLKVKGTPQHKK